MKRVFLSILLLCVLTGCSSNSEMQSALDFRAELKKAEQCSFDAVVSADYGDAVYTFQMNCISDATEGLRFTVTDPDSISGITGTISGHEAYLTFDDHVLSFPPLVDGQVTPVTAPWLFFETLSSGYIVSCEKNGEELHLIMDDSYQENPIRLDIWLDTNDVPMHCDILYSGKRILSLDIKNFSLA